MFKFKGALDGHSDKIAVFNLPPTDASVESTEWIEYRPSGQLLFWFINYLHRPT